MTRIAFFGHDVADAAVRRRVQGFRDDGCDVIGFMMRRDETTRPEWDNVDLGRTFDAAYVQRVRSILTGAERAAASIDKLRTADLIWARNLDMLATAFLTKRRTGLSTPVVYEALDIHRLLTRNDPIGFAFRRLEGDLLRRCRRLVVSSPGFLRNYYEPRQPGRYRAELIENRLAAGGAYGPRPASGLAVAARPLRIGWVGVLRCARSLELLLQLATRFGDTVQLDFHGQPALTEIPDFHAKIARHANVAFHGRYKAPEDLARIYGGLDVVWAGDFMEAGYNSVWLLPNRLYEGGYYATPPIAPAGTETARWIDARGVGFSVPEALGDTLPRLIEHLLAAPQEIAQRRERLLALPDEAFIQPVGLLKRLVESALLAEPSSLTGGGVPRRGA